MKRLTAILFAMVALAAPAAACAQQGAIERIEAKVDQVLHLLQKGVPPVVTPPTVDPVPVTPVTPAGGPQCSDGGPHVINGQGTRYNVCTCSAAVVTVRNAMPGSRLIVTKMTGSGQPSVPPGLVSIHEGGQLLGVCGSTCPFDIGMGDRDFTFRSEVACTNLAVQVR